MKRIVEPQDLAGEELNGVCFVMDYVEFHFNGPVLRSLRSAQVKSLLGDAVFPGPGARDALCQLIGAVVRECEVREGVEILVSFVDGEELRISLAEEENTGPEAAHFVLGPSGPIQVW